MYQFTNFDGTPVDEWTNNFLNERITDNHEEYDQLIHQIAAYFSKWNKEVCSDCNAFQKARSDYNYDWGRNQSRFAYSHGCCAHCYGNLGYLRGNWDGDTERTAIVEHFHFDRKTHGFFDEKKFGCGLPRHLRSQICLVSCCDYKKVDEIRDLVDRVCEIRGYK